MKQQSLEDLLGQMSDAQIANWGLFVLKDCFAIMRKKYWWNVYGLILQFRAKRILEDIGAGRVDSEESAFREVEKVRWMADSPFGLGDTYFKASGCICNFFSEFQVGFEMFRTHEDKTLGQDSFRQLAGIPRKLAKYNLAGLPPDPFMEACVQKAKELIRG